MSVGVWKPEKPDRIGVDKMRALLNVYRDAEPENLTGSFAEEDIQTDAVLMKLEEAAWQDAAQLDDDELHDLIRFFTLAEMQLPNWEGGARSPVIYLVRVLKARNAFTTELRRWIKANTDNRYLPYGRAL